MQQETKAFLTAAQAIWRWKLIVLLVAVISVGAVYFQQSKTARNFEAHADLLFRFGREYYPISPGEQRRNWGENVIVSLDAAIFTEMRLLSTHQLFERTLDTVGMDDVLRSPVPVAEPQRAADEDPRLAAIRKVADMFEISRVDGASLIEVSARHPIPEIADKLLNAHIDNYLMWRNELFDQDASAYFDIQLAGARDEHAGLIAARKALVAEYGILDAQVERDMLRRGLVRASEAGVLADDIRERLQLINTFESLVEPIDARINAVLDNITSLEGEQANWKLTQEFGASVAPSVVPIDFRTAMGVPVGLSPAVSAVAAGVLSAILMALLIAGFGLISEAAAQVPETPKRPAPGKFNKPAKARS